MGQSTKLFRVSSTITTTSTCYVDVTSATITLDNNSGGKAFVSINNHARHVVSDGKFIYFRLLDDGTSIDEGLTYMFQGNTYQSLRVQQVMDDNGSVIKANWRVTGGTGYWQTNSTLIAFEVF